MRIYITWQTKQLSSFKSTNSSLRLLIYDYSLLVLVLEVPLKERYSILARSTLDAVTMITGRYYLNRDGCPIFNFNT